MDDAADDGIVGVTILLHQSCHVHCYVAISQHLTVVPAVIAVVAVLTQQQLSHLWLAAVVQQRWSVVVIDCFGIPAVVLSSLINCSDYTGCPHLGHWSHAHMGSIFDPHLRPPSVLQWASEGDFSIVRR